MSSRLGHIMPDTVTYATWSTGNNSGDPSWGSQSTADARVEFGSFKTRNAQGVEVDAQARIFTETDIPRKARVWLPGDDTAKGNEARKVTRRVEASTPDAGLTLYELYL